jgi:quercetin dioxygenase-like cupin family protein
MNDTNLPADDVNRTIKIVNADTQTDLKHLSLAGNTYTMLLTGEDTAGEYDLIDMYIAPGGGPPPHRHNFEEMFTILDGTVEYYFRGETYHASTGDTVNIPANAPHNFKNISDKPARMLCMCTPAAQAEYFLSVGDLVDTRTSPPLEHTQEELSAMRTKAGELASKYRTEMI